MNNKKDNSLNISIQIVQPKQNNTDMYFLVFKTVDAK